jgi:hypothetical protein
MNPYKLILGGFTAFLVFTLLACPAMAQLSNAAPAVVTQLSVEAVTNKTGTIVKSYPKTLSELRTTANAYCKEYPVEWLASCLAIIKSYPLFSLNAFSPTYVEWIVPLQKDIVGGVTDYIRIVASRAP